MGLFWVFCSPHRYPYYPYIIVAAAETTSPRITKPPQPPVLPSVAAPESSVAPLISQPKLTRKSFGCFNV